MKISVLIIEDGKQIMLTPENDHEKAALKMIAPDDKIEAVTKWGSFFDKEERMVGYQINKCQGGYFRPYPDEESLMFIVTKSDDNKVKEDVGVQERGLEDQDKVSQ